MALITSHTLNGVDGTHACHVQVQLLEVEKTGEPIFDTQMDGNGRLSRTICPKSINPLKSYDLVFFTGHYWASTLADIDNSNITQQVIVRFHMPDPEGHYHMPIILSPKSYSVWLSG